MAHRWSVRYLLDLSTAKRDRCNNTVHSSHPANSPVPTAHCGRHPGTCHPRSAWLLPAGFCGKRGLRIFRIPGYQRHPCPLVFPAFHPSFRSVFLSVCQDFLCPHPYRAIDNRDMVVRHIKFRSFSIVWNRLVAQEIDGNRFLHFAVTNIFFIPEDKIHTFALPFCPFGEGIPFSFSSLLIL